MGKESSDARKASQDRIAKLEEKKKQLQARITRLKNAQESKSRKEETRKKIIVGGWFLSLLDKDDRVKELYSLFLEKGLMEKDRKLF